MKATGIVRRVDDLGRVVIPKEIRRTMRIAEGDPLEIFIDGDGVCYKKYNVEEVYIDQIKNILKDVECDIDLKERDLICRYLKDIKLVLENNEIKS